VRMRTIKPHARDRQGDGFSHEDDVGIFTGCAPAFARLEAGCFQQLSAYPENAIERLDRILRNESDFAPPRTSPLKNAPRHDRDRDSPKGYFPQWARPALGRMQGSLASGSTAANYGHSAHPKPCFLTRPTGITTQDWTDYSNPCLSIVR